MKKLLLALALILSLSTTRAQYVAIPDSNFGNWLFSHGFSSCLTGNSISGWQLDTTCPAVLTATTLSCGASRIHDFTGVRFFSALSDFDCHDNQLNSLPTLPAGLTTLNCYNNNLSSLPALPTSLTYLDCTLNNLDSLPALPASLIHLDCSANFSISRIPVLPPSLSFLKCENNQIHSLPVLPASLTTLLCRSNQMDSLSALPSSLLVLDCSNNRIHTLPVLPASLTQLACGSNPLTILPTLPQTLIKLDCTGDQLSSLPVLPSAMNNLLCSNNMLSQLPALPTSLRQLICMGNRLNQLPALPAGLLEIRCSNNQLTSLPIMPDSITRLLCDHNQLNSLPYLPATINTLSCSYNSALSCLPPILSPRIDIEIMGTAIQCMPNRFSASIYDINPSTLPLCDPASGCDFYYNIAGTTHQYTAAGCAADSLSPGAALHDVKVKLLHGGQVVQQIYSALSGSYSFKTDTLTDYQIAVDTAQLLLATSCPATGVRGVLLTATDTVKAHEGFGLSCAGSDYGVISQRADRIRPGFTTTLHQQIGDIVKLRYGAACAAAVQGTVTTSWSGSVSYVSAAPGALTPAVSGNTLTYSIADLSTLQAGDLDVLFAADTLAAAGTSVCITTIVSPQVADINPADDTLTQCYTISNSLDPNIKEVYPTALQQNQSEWLTYTIHFQNTGNDTAYTVVVRDTLSNNVQPESFQYLASSHHAVIQLFGKAMVFTFPKINLVDSATNPALSQGWIQYKVKTKANLPMTTQVKNTAYIYFDLNPAVVTNTAVSTVTITGLDNVRDMGVVRLYPNPNKGSFTLESTITDGEYRIYDMMGALVAQHTISAERELVSLPDATAGVYTLVVKNGSDSKAMRLMIEK